MTYIVTIKSELMKKSSIEEQLTFCETIRTRIKAQFDTTDIVVVLPDTISVTSLLNTGVNRTDIVVPDTIHVTTNTSLSETINQNVNQNVYNSGTQLTPIP